MKLGDRMKQYEYVTRTYLPCRMPVIVRIDGRSFHTFTKGFTKPFDALLSDAMARTASKLLESVEGCVFAYAQSDEISLLLKNDQTLETNAWFDNNLSKIISLSASIATLYFNRYFAESMDAYEENWNIDEKVMNAYYKAIDKGATFDARAFVIPEGEVVNYFIWRQEDATKNSIQMVAQANFPHKQLQGLNCSQLQEKLFQEKGINWGEDTLTKYKRGIAVYKKEIEVETPNGVVMRNKAFIDEGIPIFTQDRKFIEERYFTHE